VTDEDRMISPDLQRQIANKISANVVTLHAGHVPFLSKPTKTADVILAAVDLVRCEFSASDSIAAGRHRA
jgi:pimeloyl-ACP methyl ester carboxylesterase